MRDNVKDLLSLRTVVVRFPDGEKEYWLSEATFSRGDELSRNGRAWLVDEVLDPTQTGDHTTVKLREADV
jgi:hypothetical protein